MGTTADKLNKLLQTKQTIKQAIIDKGIDVSDDAKFADYPSKIKSIQTGDSESVWNIVTNNYTRGSHLFYGCFSLTSLDLSNWNTNNVTDMGYMFWSCNNLTSLNVSNFDTSNVSNMSSMFQYCYNLTSLDVSNFDTSNVSNMSNMFATCEKLTELDLSNFDTSKVTNMSNMLYQCKSLTSLNVNNFNVSKVTNMASMFNGCTALTKLDVSAWDVGHITASYYFGSIFDNCTALVDFYPPQNINADMNVSSSTALSHDSLMRIINNLKTTTSTKKLTLGKINLAKLSDEEKAIATGKGWTLA